MDQKRDDFPHKQMSWEWVDNNKVFNRLGSKVLYVKDTELIRSKCSGVAEVTYSFGNLVRC